MNTEVLVVGAGPVGLTLANELDRLGVTCRVVDRAAGPGGQSRAITIHCRTQELLERAGLRGSLAARAIPIYGMRLARGGRQLATIPFDLGAYPALSLPQSKTEPVLREALAARGVGVEWGRELTGLRQSDSGVLVEAGGETIESSYVVGCDGAHSAVRHLLGVDFAGDALPETLWMADAALEWDVAPDHAWQFLHPAGALSAIPMPDGVWRLAAMRDDAAGDPTAEFFGAAVERVIGRPARRLDIAWMSTFRVNCRLAEAYRRGRVFLAGDAAHIHSPIGGQGMNMGMRDAFDLAARLATALAGGGEAALDAYEAARRPIAAAVIRANARVTRLGMARGPVARLVRDYVMPAVLALPPVARRTGRAAAGLGEPLPADAGP